MKALGQEHCPLMPVTAAPSLPRYSLFFDVGQATRGGGHGRCLTKKLVSLIQGKHTLIYGDAVHSFIACARGGNLARADSMAEWCRAPLWKIHLQGRCR